MLGAMWRESQKREEEERADARERSRFNAAKRMLAQRAARAGRYGAHDREESARGGVAGDERRLETHDDASWLVITGEVKTREREEVMREEAKEQEEENQPPSPPKPPRIKPKKKTPTMTTRPKARNTWMSAVDTRWPQPDPAPTLRCDREKRHSCMSLSSPSTVGDRRAAYAATVPLPTPSVRVRRRRNEEQERGRARRSGGDSAPATPPDPARPATLSASEAARVRRMMAHSGSEGTPGEPSLVPPFTLASLRRLEVAHPLLRSQHAVLQRVTPSAILARWATFLSVADENEESNLDKAEGGREEATRRRLARRMGGMLVAYGAWAATAATAGGGEGGGDDAGAGACAGADRLLANHVLANHVLADLSRDAEQHGAWTKAAVSEWREYRSSWFR